MALPGSACGAPGNMLPSAWVDIPPETDIMRTASNRVGLVGTFGATAKRYDDDRSAQHSLRP